ncbi:Golgi membrane protein 1 [Thomomys bottae]
MMGLGNGRRSMKSPPLVLAALVACVVVLGFNYWIASSRSMELQTQVLELENRVRRAAAERGAVELKKNEFQGELQKQREQLDKIQYSHHFQLESVNRVHQDEKAMLVNNITTSERLIRDLQDQLKALQKSYDRLQQDVVQFQRNQTSLEKKFSYDLSQCINQIKEVKEQCEEQRREVTKSRKEVIASKDLGEKSEPRQQLEVLSASQPLQEAGQPQAQVPQGKEPVPSNGRSPISTPSSEVVLDVKRGKKDETNEIEPVTKEPQRDSLGLPREPGQGQVSADRLGTRAFVGADKNGQITQAPAALLARPADQDPEDPEREQLVIRDGQEEQDASEEEKEENKAESETDKQAALAENKNSNNFNAEDQERENKFT